MNVLMMKDVSLTYQTIANETKALDEVNFSVNKGEFVAFVGPSGCGKTTILSLIAGLLKPTEGKIYLNGKEIVGVSPEVGYMLQKDHLFPWRSVEENVLLGLEIAKKKNSDNVEYARGLLEKYSLKEFSKHYPFQLSGGMRQRVALIRTLVLKPEILLLDEPFSALDFQTRLKVCDDVYSIIKKEGKTAILVTHDISEAVSLADRIFVLTNRPASIKRVFTPVISGETPLRKREDSAFAKWFNLVWKEIPS